MVAKRNASRSAIHNFMGNIPINRNDIIASFVPIANEIDIKFLTETLYENANKIVLPVVLAESQPLIFRQYSHLDNLVFNKKYKTYEPPESYLELTPTILIVPLIACDKLGNRIGFGGGFYDRTIELLEKSGEIFTVGICYDFQILDKIPISEYDKKLDCIITDKKVVICLDNTENRKEKTGNKIKGS